ncbi:MAG: hypothetical protein NVS3B3_22650 [Aquirhabdus sp.]
MGGIYDPINGNLKRTEYLKALSFLVQRISGETKATLVLRPNLVLRTAKLAGSAATWDGQQRRVPVLGSANETWRYDGTTQGLSVELTAFSADGALVVHSFGGASLPFRSNLLTSKNEVRPDLFAAENELKEAVELSLKPVLGQ